MRSARLVLEAWRQVVFHLYTLFASSSSLGYYRNQTPLNELKLLRFSTVLIMQQVYWLFFRR